MIILLIGILLFLIFVVFEVFSIEQKLIIVLKYLRELQNKKEVN